MFEKEQPKYEPPDQPPEMCEHCQKSDDWAVCFDCYENLRKQIEELNRAIEKALKLIGGHQHSETICRAIVILQKALEGK